MSLAQDKTAGGLEPVPAAAANDLRGRCRICGCTEDAACMVVREGCEYAERPCWWADDGETLCDNPDCLAKAAVAP